MQLLASALPLSLSEGETALWLVPRRLNKQVHRSFTTHPKALSPTEKYLDSRLTLEVPNKTYCISVYQSLIRGFVSQDLLDKKGRGINQEMSSNTHVEYRK